MDKVCIFCGKPPIDKNKEHVLPRWLLKLTDMEGKSTSVGANWKMMKQMEFPLDRFTFPACTGCNTGFAQIEALVQPILRKVLRADYLLHAEILLLLDWFDKVRIGLWFAARYLNSTVFNFGIKYPILPRVGLKDRILSVAYTNDTKRHLWWTGCNSLAFMYSPNCFSIKINNVIFTSASSDFLVSRQLGFPYPSFIQPNPSGTETNFRLVPGHSRVSNTIFKSQLYQPNVMVCQPIFGIPKQKMPTCYGHPFVEENSLSFDTGIGKLFVAHDEMVYAMDTEEELSFENSKFGIRELRFNRPTYELQNEIMQMIPYNLDLLTDSMKESHHHNLETILEYSREQLRQFDY